MTSDDRHQQTRRSSPEGYCTGAPWRIRLTAELKARFLATPGDGLERIRDAVENLGLGRQIVFLHAGAYWLMWGLRAAMPRRSSFAIAQF
ncbi:transposase, partial [Mesorhizobium australicum]|uniref:hypothetical protein n=1 Tax=Mesorhizobium australicum TaxID=536018 RepID=UPI00333AAD91